MILTIPLDRHNSTPLYEQLYREILRLILEGVLPPNMKMPSKRALAVHLKVAPVTVETAYAQLMAEGYLRSIPKSGYYVETFLKPIWSDSTIAVSIPPSKESWDVDMRTYRIDTEALPKKVFAQYARNAILDSIEEELESTTVKGSFALRTQIAKHLSVYRGFETEEDDIVLGSGTESFLPMILSYLGKTMKVGVENPGYSRIRKMYELFEVDVVPISLDEFGMSVEEALRQGVNVIHISPSHQFPSGIVMPLKRRMEWLEWAEAAPNRYIIEDDYDSELRFSGSPIPALRRWNHQKVIYMNSFSRSMFPSLRVSFMVMPKPWKSSFDDQLGFLTCPVGFWEQQVLTEFLEQGGFDRHLNRMKSIYRSQRDQLLSLIRQSLFGRSVTILGEEAGLHFLLRFDDQTKEHEAILSLRQKRIRIVGYQDYFWERNDQASCCFVMGYAGLKEKAMIRFIAEIEDMWMKQHFELVRPNLSMGKAYFEYLEEWGKEAKMVPFAARFQQDSFEAWLDQKKREEDPQTTPEGWVRATLFALMVDGKIAGFLHLRHDLNEHLLQVGGHIGYGIRPSMRGKGYAKIMLRLGLLEAKKLGLSKVLITADDDNPASYRTIESCGGILENRFHEEEHDVLRYWIDIQNREF